VSDIRIGTWRNAELIKALPLEIGSTKRETAFAATMSVHSIIDAVQHHQEKRERSVEVFAGGPAREPPLRLERYVHAKNAAINPPMRNFTHSFRGQLPQQIHIKRWCKPADADGPAGVTNWRPLSSNKGVSYSEDYLGYQESPFSGGKILCRSRPSDERANSP